MGVSTNGIVFYGFLINEDEDEAFEQFAPLFNRITGRSDEDADEDADEDEGVYVDVDVDEIVAKLYGWDGENPQYCFEWENEHPSPITIGMHCSHEYPMYYVAIKASEVTAYRGHPKSLNEVLSIQPKLGEPTWNDLLCDFCERAGITPPPSDKFGWFVVSMWG